MKLEDKISGIPFSKTGHGFRFWTHTADPNFMVEEFAKKINPSFDAFVGIESRGFIIAMALAL